MGERTTDFAALREGGLSSVRYPKGTPCHHVALCAVTLPGGGPARHDWFSNHMTAKMVTCDSMRLSGA